MKRPTMRTRSGGVVLAFCLAFATAAGAQEIVLDNKEIGEMLLRNDEKYAHVDDPNMDFGNGHSHVIVAADDFAAEDTGGLHIDGDAATIWSPGDQAPGQPMALLYILDDDNWTDSDGDPFNNGAVKVYLDTAGLWQTSDRLRKQNVQRLSGSLARLQALNGYSYEFGPNEAEVAKGQQPIPAMGLLAQELAEVVPTAVQSSDDGEMYVNYSFVVPMLIEAIKEQQSQIEALEDRLSKLEKF